MRVEPIKLFPAGVSSLGQDNATPAVGSKSFAEVFSSALDDVNKLQQDASQASTNLATGKIQDISEVTVATEKATLALQLTMQVRNKILDAYQEIMRMQV
jgi:flagellar hook-basal body complex protein FliE